MRKVLFIMLTLSVVLTVSAQKRKKVEEPVVNVTLTNGVYETKTVVNADSIKSSTLYVRALEALSDWTGSLSKSKIGIDIQDKDEGLVVYKGQYYLGYEKANMLCGWDTFADFTLKVRCKDGRAQLIVTVPSMTFIWDGDGHGVHSFAISEFLPVYKYKGVYKIKKAAQKFAPKVPETFDLIVNLLGKRITQKPDDDF